tara:strand:- start:14042 stop:14287 length:246 start_codon:yes stop_codon:yes gene_type:complete
MAITHGKPFYSIVPHQDFRPKDWRAEKARVEKLEKLIAEKGIDKKYKTREEAEKSLKATFKNGGVYYVQERTPVHGLGLFI